LWKNRHKFNTSLSLANGVKKTITVNKICAFHAVQPKHGILKLLLYGVCYTILTTAHSYLVCFTPLMGKDDTFAKYCGDKLMSEN